MKNTKKFFKLLFVIVVLTQSTQAQETTPKSSNDRNIHQYPGGGHAVTDLKNGTNEVEDIGVGTSWDIGRKSRNCGAFGLCRCSSISFEYSQRVKPNKNSFYSFIKITQDKKVFFSVDKENMLIISNYFKGEQLILDEDFIIDNQEVLKQLHLDSYTLKKGLYKFKFNIKTSKFEVII
jgi:hypothetical protein